MRPKDKHLLPDIGRPAPVRSGAGGNKQFLSKFIPSTLSSALAAFTSSAFAAFIFLFSLTLLSAGCNRDDEAVNGDIKNTVDGITFSIGATGMGAASPSTKSSSGESISALGATELSQLSNYDERFEIYSTPVATSGGNSSATEMSSNLKYSGEKYDVTIAGQNYKYESINWEVGDKISIGMANNEDNAQYNFIDYKIKTVTPSNISENKVRSSATIEVNNYSDRGIRWNSGSNASAINPGSSAYSRLLWENAPDGAFFYAFWPSINSRQRNPSYVSVNKNGDSDVSASFDIPSSQVCYKDSDPSISDKLLYRPDMSYAYMTASDFVSTAGNDVKLTFYPDFTAFEFILKNESSSQMRLKSVRLQSINNNISGSFVSNCQIASGDRSFSRTISEGGTNSNSITLTFEPSIESSELDYPLISSIPLQFTILAGSATGTVEGSTSAGITGRDATTISGVSIFLDMQISTDGGSTWTDAPRQLDLRRVSEGDSDWIKIPVRSKVVITNLSVPESTIGGFTQKEFKVSPSKKVYFSPGNLQVRIRDGVPQEWRFAPKQYEHLGLRGPGYRDLDPEYYGSEGNANFDGVIPTTNPSFYTPQVRNGTGWVDMFAWSDGDLSDASGNRYGLDLSYNSSTATFVDYSNLSINYGTASTGGWSVLSREEWQYLLNSRPDSDKKWSLATVGNVKGLVILPDDWTLPSNCKFTPLGHYTTNTYSTLNHVGKCGSWGAMEKAGAVFLPAVGFDKVSNYYQNFGFYWTSTHYTGSPTSTHSDFAYNFVFESGTAGAHMASNERYRLMSVRLVVPTDHVHYYLVQPDELTISANGNNAVSSEFSFESYKSADGGVTKDTADFVVTYSIDYDQSSGSGTFYTYDDPSMDEELRKIIRNWQDPVSVGSFTASSGSQKATISLLGNSNYTVSGDDERTSRASTLRSRPANGYTIDNPQDLSLTDALTGTVRGASEPQTANSYIIQKGGWYMLPCVYGNAIDYVKAPTSPYWNTLSYNPSISGSSYTVLKPFKGHTGAGITNPMINQYAPISLSETEFVNNYEAVIIWQDVSLADQFVNIPVGSSETTAPGSGMLTASLAGTTVPYIRFYVDENKIQEGNIVIGLRQKGKTTFVWSWHIWVSAETLQTKEIMSYSYDYTELLSVPLGWNGSGGTSQTTYEPRTFYAKITQKVSKYSKIFKVSQSAVTTAARTGHTRGNAPYYQWGRKDPFLPGDSDAGTSYNKKWSSPSGYSLYANYNNQSQVGYQGIPQDVAGGAAARLGVRSPNAFADAIIYPHLLHGSSRRYTWWPGDPYYYNLWSANNTDYSARLSSPRTPPVKTIYDPCPPGFSVPRYWWDSAFLFDSPSDRSIDDISRSYVRLNGDQSGTVRPARNPIVSTDEITIPILGHRNVDFYNAHYYGELSYYFAVSWKCLPYDAGGHNLTGTVQRFSTSQAHNDGIVNVYCACMIIPAKN